MVTAAGVAHANRLPVLLLPGDTFAGRAPDPVLQQVEHYGDPTATVNDAFRPVSRYFDRITRPEQLLATLPQVARVLTDPADAGPVVLALPQDVQVEEFDFPAAMFEPRLHRVPRPRADRDDLAAATEALRGGATTAARPRGRRALLRRGRGGCSPSPRPTGSPSWRRSPAARWCRTTTRCTAGRWASSGATSANDLAAEADVVLAVGTRLQDFTTSSWTGFAADVRLVTINAARFDAVKHAAHAVVGDARETLLGAGDGLAGWSARRRRGRPARRPGAASAGTRHVDGLRAGGVGARRRRSPTPRSPGSSTTPRVPTTTCSPLVRRDARRAARRLAHRRRTTGRHLGRHDGPRVRLLLHGLRDRRAVGRGHGARDDPPGRTGHLDPRRRLVPDAQLRALLGGVRRAPVRRRACATTRATR